MPISLSYLHQAIEQNDKQFIITYLAKDDFTDIGTLNPEQKIKLLQLLTLTNVQSIKLAKHLLRNMSVTNQAHRKAISKVCRDLERNTNDHRNLLILKGKIDFMKMRFNEMEREEDEKKGDIKMKN